jgi:glycosyltransferase involved in cell wall biosynthesis
MKLKKVVIILSNVSKAYAFEWTTDFLSKEKIAIHFVLLNNGNSSFENYLKSKNYSFTRFTYKNKLQFIPVFLKLLFHLIKVRPEIVHCHLFEASLLGLTAAKLIGIKKRIYTRHHSTLQHKYYKNGVKYDLWCNKMATHIIAISEVVKKTLIDKEGVDAKKIVLIHHGFKLSEFQNISESRINNLRNKYKIPSNLKVIGVISRYLHLKGVSYIIDAFKEILKNYPDAFLVLANASGEYTHVIKKELKPLPENSYTEIVFEEDLFALYKLFSIFIHVPIDEDSEAFGQTYIESLASGVPSIFTLSGVANEFIKNNYNAIVVKHKNSSEIKDAIMEILQNEILRTSLIDNGKISVNQFGINDCVNKLENLYLN